MAQFSDTTNKNGLIQLCEFWTRQPDGTITGTLLKQFTARINAAFEEIVPLFLSYNDQIRWDDTNNTDAPIGYINLVANQNDYKITVDDNSYDILNITKVRIKQSSSDTTYYELERITADDPRVPGILSPDSTVTGKPSAFVELGNIIYLDILPDTSITNGIEIFFGRQQQYFTSSDTTKEPGIPLPFHELLAMIAARDWVFVNKSDDRSLINGLTEKIAERKKNLKNFIDLRHPTKVKMTMRPTRFR